MLQSVKSKQSFLGAIILSATLLFVSSCVPTDTTSGGGSGGGGSGTVMGCSPPTGCYPPTSWEGGGFCYSSPTACHNDGWSKCRECY